MNIKIGCDLVCISRFKNNIERNGTKLLEKIFCKEELKNSKKLESLAGIFAAKEAVIKALEIPTDWLNIEILKKENGKPFLKLENFQDYISNDISISHDQQYAFAVATFLMKDQECY